MPEIPPEHGRFLSNLIRRCWSTNPVSRPSFDEILRAIQVNEFAIIPGADSHRIRESVNGVLDWERQAGS
jgi:hypothetical protein